jgi:hypothetical protein
VIRYPYVTQVEPPAPFIHVTVRCPTTGKEVSQLAAQVDTAADRSVLPWKVVDQLGLVVIREIPLGGLGGNIVKMSTFLVQIEPRHLQPVTIEAVATPHESVVLLGRDVLNHFRLVLDGPGRALEIG